MHTGACGQEQGPQTHVGEQNCEPYVLHVSMDPGMHAPWLLQVPSCQEPVGLHVWTSVPQLPHAAVCVCPGPQTPWHVPPTHVMFVHAEPTVHMPVMLHASGAFMVVHCSVPGVHTPLHCPLTHAWFMHATGFPNVPVMSHDST
jgi:hypothetical protein